ncbi:M28 family metallopeptidase [Brevundimonas variabilis]|uniref:Zn-dependent M28 family amino/carboxypeptidase n=1 Tax=Brevundimonas variabilis TaxID=74312 RepID=A0A7W9CIY7_9CAUL|nr:M28 family metallopeptidase [Brevundimonas variabilis]MBB5746497.1 Zn-dependent M28 family amino/carboxypeptidase [Brevundimonas variabilis]
MRLSKPVLAALGWASILSACASAPGAEPTTPATFDAARLSEHIRVLSADDFQGRGIATPAEDKVIAYLSEQFSKAGFQPGGENGGWTQAVTLNRFTAANGVARLQVGDWSRPLTPGEDIVMSSRLPGNHVMLMDAELVFVGYGITAPERQWDDFKDVDVRGKILVVLVNDADFEEPALNTFGGRAMTYYGRWTYKYEEAARRGAAGVIIVHEDAPASYGWTTVRNSWSGPQFDIVRANAARERVALEAWLQRPLAVELFQRSGLDFEALKVRARSRTFRPVVLEGASFSGMFDVATTTVETHNILARLPGTTRPDETVLYTGHWDHIGVGTPDASGDAIFNGAIDNASGISGMIELARVWAAGPRPERSIVMIGFTAEESGLLGSEYYAANPIYPLEKTVGGFNMDSANVYGRTAGFRVVGYGQSDFDDRMATVVQAQGRVVEPDGNPASGGYFRSDHFPLAKRGVPMAYAASGGEFRDEPIAARNAARSDYTSRRYHQADDEWSADWDYTGQIEDLNVYLAVGRDLANSRAWPQWKPGSEFAPARAASDAVRQ